MNLSDYVRLTHDKESVDSSFSWTHPCYVLFSLTILFIYAKKETNVLCADNTRMANLACANYANKSNMSKNMLKKLHDDSDGPSSTRPRSENAS